MATLYVENVPEELYEAIRARAKRNRTSISAEVLAVLGESVPTPTEVQRRKTLIERARKLRSRAASAAQPFAATEEMLREDRAR